ncbi:MULTISPECIES: hypothetical protein [unclassified Psychrobacter]|uniref:hypothetical protein n=1 Tax=unclassified Psychrobacter TaxID=196806 RepID=UPI0025B3CEA9|nr:MULTISPECIES: hypothetical protein [unclassified Psychrobacter]MDN3452042.1 hypothetical protein [Psychrobacter sp. APC 3350]MDN3501342.1 hypothetical protein [Psychrobacter sp. 5A.1]
MLIPKYWAQYKQRFELSETADNASDDFNSKQATIKRYGWSDISQADALAHAKARVKEAHQRWLDGEDIVRRERREEYNESNGIPIREQIISEQNFSENGLTTTGLENKAYNTQLIVTRNSYGAQVANVNDIAIIDVDNNDLLHQKYPDEYDSHGFIGVVRKSNNVSNKSKANDPDQSSLNNYDKPVSMKSFVWTVVIAAIILATFIAMKSLSWLWLLLFLGVATAILWQQASKYDQEQHQRYMGHIASLQTYIMDLIQQRIISHPQESFRLYETPAGFRIIATHDTISSSDALVADWFEYFHADTNYVRLCQAQQCFRARLTAKPWRMAEVEDKKLTKEIPAKNFWFDVESMNVDSSIEQRQKELKARKEWINNYDKYAKNYRACRYVERFTGKEGIDRNTASTQAIDAFIKWHDDACQVDKELEMA